MSNVYNMQPPTDGKVVISTTVGDIDVELWPKQAPKAVRNFVQLCLEGYYDGVIFHRVIPKFMAQTGDPSGTGEGGDSVYGEPFDSEPHSRLKFVHRGLVAMAGSGPSSNGSQFFFTLDECSHLNGHHTIFGKVTGNSLYNMDALGSVDCDEEDRPRNPPKVISTDVVNNPFDDIVPRAKAKPVEQVVQPKKKGRKDVKLLSFGDEAEEDMAELQVLNASKKKATSAHDVLPSGGSSGRLQKEKVDTNATPTLRVNVTKGKIVDSSDDDDESDTEGRRVEHSTATTSSTLGNEESTQKSRQSKIDEMRDEIRAMKRRTLEAEAQAMALSRNEDGGRGGVGRKAKRFKTGREAATMAKLANFKSFLGGQKTDSPGEISEQEPLENNNDNSTKDNIPLQNGGDAVDSAEPVAGIDSLDDFDDSDWMHGNLKFDHRREAKDPFSVDDYTTVDPLKDKRGKGWSKINKTSGGWSRGGPMV